MCQSIYKGTKLSLTILKQSISENNKGNSNNPKKHMKQVYLNGGQSHSCRRDKFFTFSAPAPLNNAHIRN